MVELADKLFHPTITPVEDPERKVRLHKCMAQSYLTGTGKHERLAMVLKQYNLVAPTVVRF